MFGFFFFFLLNKKIFIYFFFFFQAEDGIRDKLVTGVQTCALPIFHNHRRIDFAKAGATRQCYNKHRWLWVPAFAGTTTLRELPRAPGRTAPVLQRRPDAAREA